MDAHDNEEPEDLEESLKQAKKLLLDVIFKKCATSPNATLQKVHDALHVYRDGSKLKAKVISGGFTNYSYKVYVNKHPDLCVFAKFALEYAQYNLKRTQNEYKIMKKISAKANECVAAPIACWDVKLEGRNMKLLLTEWSGANEQFSNQFMDGVVDPRIAPKIANTLAALHTIKEFDPSFNESSKPKMNRFLTHMKMVALIASNSEDPLRRTDAYCAKLGEETVMKIIDANIADYSKRDCLIHSEAHAFNMMVEAKPSIEQLEDFGPNGTMILDDWEMAMAGPIGKDIGLALAYPIGCMIAHALNGHADANASIETFINTLMDTYCAKMTEAGKTPKEIDAIVRNIVGWTGWFQYFTFYIMDVFPFPAESDASKLRLRDALGVLGFKLLRLSYDREYVAASASAKDIRRIFNSLWGEEIKRGKDAFAAGRGRRQPRKSSIWRTTSRRLSATEMLYLTAERRVSKASIGDSLSRLSVGSGDIGESVKSAAESLRRQSIGVSISETMKSIPEGFLAEDDSKAIDSNYDEYLAFLSHPKDNSNEEGGVEMARVPGVDGKDGGQEGTNGAKKKKKKEKSPKW
eukprot:CAMPEP_0183735376 /NCGR_PEP_ID=MMETSP0737-20130205/46467_1 /TAXON_ID=385413 /ORGANISM="Thalassiosira miniscula, Strain CCMP1093" /LENGTH=577 /DNA_ID=CAMNT_0025969101 /DNA_START=66 /DNA_END=1796 /DNA_ORIENTATION=-